MSGLLILRCLRVLVTNLRIHRPFVIMVTLTTIQSHISHIPVHCFTSSPAMSSLQTRRTGMRSKRPHVLHTCNLRLRHQLRLPVNSTRRRQAATIRLHERSRKGPATALQTQHISCPSPPIVRKLQDISDRATGDFAMTTPPT